MKRWFCSALAAAVLAAASTHADVSTDTNLWSLMAKKDLNEIYDQLKVNSPEAVDKEHPLQAEWVHKGFNESLKLTDQVNDFAGYFTALTYYTGGFWDPHLVLVPHLENRTVSWTRLISAYDNKKFFIADADNTLENPPEVGSEILEIDGIPPIEYMKRYILKYYGGAPTSESAYRLKAHLLLTQYDNTFIPTPKTCTIQANGKRKTLHLVWSEVLNCKIQEILTRTRRIENDFGVRPLGNGKGVWITFPTFTIEAEEQEKKMKSILDAVPSFQNRQVLVIDVRGNGGGNSAWGTTFLERLYGEAFVAKKLDEIYSGQYVEYRASPGNLAHLKNILSKLIRQLGEESTASIGFTHIVQTLENALSKGESGLVRISQKPMTSVIEENPIPKFKGKIYFLTDYSCGSACLDFADLVLAMPNVVQIGRPTGGDTPFMEVRIVPLPSGNSSIVFPIKVYRNKKRKFNETYSPSLIYPGDIKDTPGIEKWLEDISQNSFPER